MRNTLTNSELKRLFQTDQPLETDDCVPYQGTLDKDGYGHFFFRRKTRRAHRVVYWSYYGDIPANMKINHTCRNRACINIRHLRLATAKENALRESNSPAYINSQKTECPQGHKYDRVYSKQRYCSICQAAKSKRLRAKWAAENTIHC